MNYNARHRSKNQKPGKVQQVGLQRSTHGTSVYKRPDTDSEIRTDSDQSDNDVIALHRQDHYESNSKATQEKPWLKDIQKAMSN